MTPGAERCSLGRPDFFVVQATASAEIFEVANIGAEIAQYASICFGITLVVRTPALPLSLPLANNSTPPAHVRRRWPDGGRCALCSFRALPWASCCCVWRRLSRSPTKRNAPTPQLSWP